MGRKKQRTEKRSILGIIREVPRYHPEFGGGEVGNEKHMLGRVPRGHLIFPGVLFLVK